MENAGNTAAIVYYSLTGNTKAFAERFKAEGFEVAPVSAGPSGKPYVLFTPTYNFGKVPDAVRTFIEANAKGLSGVVAFGNRNWGGYFGKAGDIISTEFGVPLIRKVELRGTDKDYNEVKGRMLEWRN